MERSGRGYELHRPQIDDVLVKRLRLGGERANLDVLDERDPGGGGLLVRGGGLPGVQMGERRLERDHGDLDQELRDQVQPIVTRASRGRRP